MQSSKIICLKSKHGEQEEGRGRCGRQQDMCWGYDRIRQETCGPADVESWLNGRPGNKDFSGKTKEGWMAGTTGLEPATSDVTDLRSGLVKSLTYLFFQQLEGAMVRHG
jgi:hypothetical protein